MKNNPSEIINNHTDKTSIQNKSSKKSPAFAGLRGALLGFGRDACQCALQVLDKGADVLDRGAFLLLSLTDHVSQYFAFRGFPR